MKKFMVMLNSVTIAIVTILNGGCRQPERKDEQFTGTVISHVRHSNTHGAEVDYILIVQDDAVSMMVLTDPDVYYKTKEGDKIIFSKSEWDGTYYKYSK